MKRAFFLVLQLPIFWTKEVRTESNNYKNMIGNKASCGKVRLASVLDNFKEEKV